MARGVAYIEFEDLCQQALGAEDYIAIGNKFHTVVLSGIPQMTAEMRNEAKRFMNLIDVLYEKKVNLVASADAPPENSMLPALSCIRVSAHGEPPDRNAITRVYRSPTRIWPTDEI